MYVEITELKKAEEELKAALSTLNATFESTEDGIMVADGKGRITNFNRKFAEIWKMPEEIMQSGDDEKALEYAMSQLRDPGEFFKKVMDLYSLPDAVSFDIIEFNDGRLIERYSQPQRISGHGVGRVWSFRDVTERKLNEMIASASLREKETLLKEIHHRVKNNLQVVSSLLNLESAFIKDKDDLAIFKDSRSRVRSMAIVHEILYKTNDISTIDFKSYIASLSDNIGTTYKTEGTKVTRRLDLEDHINVSIDSAIPSGLLINEILTNSYKYAFKGMPEGEIKITLRNTDGRIHLEISDNGIGLPDNYGIDTSSTLGFQLIKALVNQLEGDITIERNIGTKYRIVF
jgi:PAS domain S-box-containing protein